MRTTIRLNDGLLRMVRKSADVTNRTISAVIEDALRLTLQSKSTVLRRGKARIPTSGSGGLLPGVDLDDFSSLVDIMEGR